MFVVYLMMYVCYRPPKGIKPILYSDIRMNTLQLVHFLLHFIEFLT